MSYQGKQKKHIILKVIVVFVILELDSKFFRWMTKFNFTMAVIIDVIIWCLVIAGLVLWKKAKKRKERDTFFNSSMVKVDSMTTTQFNEYLKLHFEVLGYRVKLEANGPFLLKQNHETIVVQVIYSSGYTDVSEIYSIQGLIENSKADRGIVISRGYYTEDAKKLAEVFNIELWDRDRLMETMVQDETSQSAAANEILKRDIEKKTCPLCHGRLVVKNGCRGLFIGCSNFPDCWYSRDIDRRNLL